MLERRLAMSERANPTNDAGLVLGDDGVVYEVASDGTRTAIGGGGSSPFLTASIALTDAQIKALPDSADHVIVPAPGVGKMVYPLFASFVCDARGGAYANFNAFDGTQPYASSVYLVWDAPGVYNDATGPVAALGLLGFARVAWAPASPIDGSHLIIEGDLSGGTTLGNGMSTGFAAPVNQFENLPLYVTGQNNSLGAFTGGDAANSLTATVIYTVIDLT